MTVQAMNCWAVVEQVPQMWNSIDLYMLHIYYDNFDLVNASIVVKVAPMSLGEELKEGGKWHEIYNKAFPEPDADILNKPIRQKIATLDIPDEIIDQGHYCVQLNVITEFTNEVYNRGWGFEGISVTKA